MAKRVKALNDRREQLKAGITASTAKRRARLVRKNETADRMRTVLGKLQVLQEEQIQDVQQKLAQAGNRSKDLAGAEIGRASCRERGGQYEYISVGGVYLKK